MSSSGNTSYIALLGLVLLLSNWIVSKFHCSSVIILKYLRKGTWRGLFGGRRNSFILPSDNSWLSVRHKPVLSAACLSVSLHLDHLFSCRLAEAEYGREERPRALSSTSLSGTKKPDFLSALEANSLFPQRCQIRINRVSIFLSCSHSSRLGSALTLLPSRCASP